MVIVLSNSGNCFRCGQPGHWVQNCELKPAATRAEHEERIRKFGDRYAEKELTQEEKRRLIKQENELWNNREKTGARN